MARVHSSAAVSAGPVGLPHGHPPDDLDLTRAGEAAPLPRGRGEWQQPLRIGHRRAFFGLVLLLHVGLVAIAVMPHAAGRSTWTPPSIVAQIIEERPLTSEAAPTPNLTLERPHIDLVTPIVAITEPALETTQAAAPTPTTKVAAAVVGATDPPADPVTPPRFDAAYLNNPPPAYPPASRRTREQGVVLMRVRVSKDGNALEVLVERTSGSQRLDEAALTAVRHWRFVPAQRGKEAVEAWVLVPVEFELQR